MRSVKKEIICLFRRRLKWYSRILLYLITFLLSAMSVLQAVYGLAHEAAAGVFYGITAVFFALTVYYLVRDIFCLKKLISPVVRKNVLAGRLAADYRYRTVLLTCSSFLFNLLYAGLNAVYGFLYQSWWFVTLAAYYLLLSLMRFGTVRTERKNSGLQETELRKRNEWRIYKRCGLMFLVLTAILMGTVVLITGRQNGKTYTGVLIFAVAAYTFYKIIIAAVNLFKARRMQSPVISAIRCIGYADAVVSILSLQTAMLASFGTDGGVNERLMNGLTGAGAIAMIFMMGVYMTVRAGRQLRQ